MIMKIFSIVLLFAVICVICMVSGCERQLSDSMMVKYDENAFPYGLGVVWVEYDLLTSEYAETEDDIPEPVVNDFLTERGYTPRVVKMYYNTQGEVIEVIDIGADIDPTPLFEALRMLPGVAKVGLEILPDDEPPVEPQN